MYLKKIPYTFVLRVKSLYLLLRKSFVDGLLCESFAGSLVVSTYQFSHYILSSLPVDAGRGKTGLFCHHACVCTSIRLELVFPVDFLYIVGEEWGIGKNRCCNWFYKSNLCEKESNCPIFQCLD